MINVINNYFVKKKKIKKMKKNIKFYLEQEVNDVENVKNISQKKDKIKAAVLNKMLSSKDDIFQDDTLIKKYIDKIFNKIYTQKYNKQVSQERDILIKELKDNIDYYYIELRKKHDFSHEVIIMSFKDAKDVLLAEVNDDHLDYICKLSDLDYRMVVNWIDKKYALHENVSSLSNDRWHMEEAKNKKLSFAEREELNKKQALEDEMGAYALDEHEKELVRKGEYDVWDFDTEGPFEEDDYYGDDV